MLGLAQRAVDRKWRLPMGPLVGRYNPYSPAYISDPYRQLDRLRAAAPIYRSRVTGSYVISSYELASEALTDRRYGTNRKEDSSLRSKMFFRLAKFTPEEENALDNTLGAVPDEVHQHMRKAIAYDFSRRRVSALRPRMEFWVDKLLDKAAARAEFDLIGDFAAKLPILVAAELLGFPPQDAARLQEWSDSYLVLVDPLINGAGIPRMNAAFHQFDPYVAETLRRKRAEPGDDLITRLLEHHLAGEFDEVQLRVLIMMLMIAGHEVITNLIGNAVAGLLRFPDQRELLAADPDLMPAAIEEFVRYESPIQAAWRIPGEDLEIGGVRVPAKRAVTVLIGAANNDPAQFAHPRRLDLTRGDNRHIGFALGSHFCPGTWLARVEGAAALSRLLERFPRLRGDADRLRWKPAAGLRGLYELPLTL
ncbi:cytochrome P450 [Microtetraspora malaysiensis]|uniref:cytochrome P450 n=1 Tax=Microtetraspora malaysiensis TaxID=161358 RepID=UPI0012F916AD|nr:cytochrome P450 [Microtetraspora malaysiensis]